ncbi:MAG: hypothetical protein Q7O66_16420, partial [Dehalococcoidia bacterium]|nr:hypothetical protein [Dehalococcoidia bacterium]
KIQRSTRSPYTIRDLGTGKFGLFEGEEQVNLDIYFLSTKSDVMEEPLTSRGTPVFTLLDQRRWCFAMMPVRYCEYFATGDQCKFCNFNGTQDDARAIGLERAVTINPDDAVEAYKILSSRVRFVEGRLEMGGFMGTEQEAKLHLNFVEKLAGAASYKPNLSVHGQPLRRKDLQRIKDVGADCLVMQPEVWDPQLFAEVCPGKAKRDGYQRYKEACVEGVDVLGAGNVGINYVGGVTLIPANGFKTWQEARDSQIEGNNWAIENGVMPIFTNLRMPPGSVYGAEPTLREKIPPTEYYLDLTLAHHQTMMQHGLYEKLNKLMFCGFHCHVGPYAGEMGMLALAGDVGNWMADAVPEEANWLARFIASVKEPAKAELE